MTGPKILLVVSEKSRRAAFANLFKSLRCQVLTTVSAENALAALKGEFQPNVILADMDLEDMKSNDFLKKIKDNPKWKSIPFVSYTRFLNYKLTNPQSLKHTLTADAETSSHVLEILKGNISLVPGEIILWVVDAISKQAVPVPPLLSVAADILKSPPIH